MNDFKQSTVFRMVASSLALFVVSMNIYAAQPKEVIIANTPVPVTGSVSVGPVTITDPVTIGNTVNNPVPVSVISQPAGGGEERFQFQLTPQIPDGINGSQGFYVYPPQGKVLLVEQLIIRATLLSGQTPEIQILSASGIICDSIGPCGVSNAGDVLATLVIPQLRGSIPGGDFYFSSETVNIYSDNYLRFVLFRLGSLTGAAEASIIATGRILDAP